MQLTFPFITFLHRLFNVIKERPHTYRTTKTRSCSMYYLGVYNMG